MMKKILIPFLLIVAIAHAKTAVPGPPPTRNEEIKIHDINQVEMCVSNFGKFGQTENSAAGCWWPKGSAHNYIYGAGPWFGTLDGSDTLVTIGYGPHGAETEYVPGDDGMSRSDPNAIIWMYPTKWPPPAEGWNTAIPPQKSKSHQDSWCVLNDLDATAHVPGDTRPIGLVVYQTVYAWNLTSTRDIIFIRYEIMNVTKDPAKTLTDIYFGVCTDNDIGNESGTGNDIIAGIVCDTFVIGGDTMIVDDLGYQWQEDIEPGTPPWDPGAIGFDYLQSPWDCVPGEDKDHDTIPDEFERDSSYYVNNWPEYKWDVDLDGTPDWRDPSEIPQMGMTAFKRFTLDLEPNKDNERYVTLAGYNFKTLVYEPFADTAPPQPDDQRFLQCSGPFELMPESTAVVLVGIVFANWDKANQDRPDTALAQVDGTCQFIYDMNWLLPGPPSPPTLTCVPGDAQINLIWNNKPESEPDAYFDVVGTDPTSPLYDSLYRQYDFEGYRVYRSLTGGADDWLLLTECDLYNNVIFVEGVPGSETDSIRAENTGLVHSYIDSDVRNGFTYYYAITSFDFNLVSGDTIGVADTLIFESGQVPMTAAPRRDPANYLAGSIDITALSGNPMIADSNVSAAITYPMAMDSSPLYLDFEPIVFVGAGNPLYQAYLLDASSAKLDSISAVMSVGNALAHEFAIQNGMNVTVMMERYDLPGDKSIFDRIEVNPGTYPESLLVPNIIAHNWAYRGNDYRVEWYAKGAGGPVNTVRVIDMMAGDTIPFKPYRTEDSLRDGWCFQSTTQATDTLVYGTAATGTKYLYICGGRFAIAFGWMDTEPRPSASDVWTVYAVDVFPPAPAYARIQILPTVAQMPLDRDFPLNVKVCPNPYIIYNEWQQSFTNRRLKFINLPSECTLRIFTLNGELVKTIRHYHTFEAEEGEEEVLNDAGGDEWWDLLSENRQLVASGVYVFHVQSEIGEQVGKFVVVR
jgi:hypothetical protein